MTNHDIGLLAIGVDIGVVAMVLMRFGTQALIDWQVGRIQARHTAAIVAELAAPEDARPKAAA